MMVDLRCHRTDLGMYDEDMDVGAGIELPEKVLVGRLAMLDVIE